ncbi:outer membrane assembly protein AsmA [Rouxiella sp. Mn2063]|uniref:outer membrane assembly protein AsmA n=1 Tax=Rouxiella sp. Mn2063 TaxID=3395262 RepID=UPI003BEE49C6
MRRLLTTLVILLVVVIAGMTSLVFLINPNDFRDYMVNRVEQKSGYKLSIDGDLRWHVFPKLSIIAGQMSLTAPGAKIPVVSAENMRLDVKLWPLLSHQLVVSEVLLKRAVVSLTPESDASEPDAPIAPKSRGSYTQTNEIDSGWKFDIGQLNISDGLLIWQRGDSDQINVRDINLEMDQKTNRQATLKLSSRINRDQRDLVSQLSATLDLQDYPNKFKANITQFDYQLSGVGLPDAGIKGTGSMLASYQDDQDKVILSQLALNANNNQFSGTASAVLSDVPDYQLNLQFSNLNLDGLTGWQARNVDDTNLQQTSAVTSAPVIARDIKAGQEGLGGLNDFNAKLTIKADNFIYRGLQVKDLDVDADNRQGNVTLQTLTGKLGSGDFSIPGNLDVTGDSVLVSLQPTLNNIDFVQLLRAYNLPEAISGNLTMQGDLKGQGITADDFNHRWQGNSTLSVTNAHLNGLNIQQLIQQAVSRSNNRVQGMERYESYTQINKLQANATLQSGTLKLSKMSGESAFLNVKGEGSVDFSAQQCDLMLQTKITGGWGGDSDLIKRLQSTDIPLRVYGPWKQLNYQLRVDDVLRDQLKQDAKSAIQNWIDKNQSAKDKQSLESIDKKL